MPNYIDPRKGYIGENSYEEGKIQNAGPGAGDVAWQKNVDYERQFAQDREGEKSRKQLIDSNGRVLDASGKADIFDEDMPGLQAQRDKTVNYMADLQRYKVDTRRDPDAWTQSQKNKQELIDYVSRAEQNKKIYNAIEKDMRINPELYSDEARQALYDWKAEGPGRSQYPKGAGQYSEEKYIKDFNATVKPQSFERKEIPLFDGTSLVNAEKRFDADKAYQASITYGNQDSKESRAFKKKAINAVARVAHPDIDNMSPEERAPLINQAMGEYGKTMALLAFRDWHSNTYKNTPTGTTGSKTPQLGLDDAVKENIVVKDATIQVAYPVSTGGTQTHDIPAPYSMAVPQNAKTKAVVPASSEMTNSATGKPLKDPAAYQFVPGQIVTRIKNGKVETVVLGYTIDKASFANIDPTILAQKTVTSDTEVPLKFMKNVFKQAGVQYDWTGEAEKQLSGKPMQMYKLNNPPKATSPKPAATPPAKKKLKPIGNLNF